MKTAAGLVVLILFVIILGFLVRNANVQRDQEEMKAEDEPSTLVLSYGKEGLVAKKPLIVEGEGHFKNMRQLTFGGENAEAYFSSDAAG